MTALEDFMSTNDEYIIEAARQAAETVVAAYAHGSAPMATSDEEMATLTALAEDLRHLEELSRSTDERTHRTFEALHDTLVQIADRLDHMEQRPPANRAPATEVQFNRHSPAETAPAATKTPARPAGLRRRCALSFRRTCPHRPADRAAGQGERQAAGRQGRTAHEPPCRPRQAASPEPQGRDRRQRRPAADRSHTLDRSGRSRDRRRAERTPRTRFRHARYQDDHGARPREPGRAQRRTRPRRRPRPRGLYRGCPPRRPGRRLRSRPGTARTRHEEG